MDVRRRVVGNSEDGEHEVVKLSICEADEFHRHPVWGSYFDQTVEDAYQRTHDKQRIRGLVLFSFLFVFIFLARINRTLRGITALTVDTFHISLTCLAGTLAFPFPWLVYLYCIPGNANTWGSIQKLTIIMTSIITVFASGFSYCSLSQSLWRTTGVVPVDHGIYLAHIGSVAYVGSALTFFGVCCPMLLFTLLRAPFKLCCVYVIMTFGIIFERITSEGHKYGGAEAAMGSLCTLVWLCCLERDGRAQFEDHLKALRHQELARQSEANGELTYVACMHLSVTFYLVQRAK